MYPVSAMAYSVIPQSTSVMVGDTTRTATLSSLEESQDGGEWAIRVGDAPPPVWGKKRSLSQEDTLEDEPKRQKVDSR